MNVAPPLQSGQRLPFVLVESLADWVVRSSTVPVSARYATPTCGHGSPCSDLLRPGRWGMPPLGLFVTMGSGIAPKALRRPPWECTKSGGSCYANRRMAGNTIW